MITMRRVLKYGNTTGACATAAAKAALITLLHDPVDKVGIPSPLGVRFEILVKECRKLTERTAVAHVIKDAGDDVDVTDNLKISATVKLTDNGQIVIKSGEGIGIVTKPGLPVSQGEPAINPTPRKMIREGIREVLPNGKGVEVTISVPQGEKVSQKTLNPKLGIIGGISILGTTGVVKPVSKEAYKRSLEPQIDVVIAQEYSRIILVPGNIGEKWAKQILEVPEDVIVQTGDYIGYMLDKAVEKGMKEIMIFGHPGKLVKLAAKVFNTHHKVADARMEVIAAYAGSVGADTKQINRMLQSNTTEEAMELLNKSNLLRSTFDKIAGKICSSALERVENKAKISAVMVSLSGDIVGVNGNLRSMKRWPRSG